MTVLPARICRGNDMPRCQADCMPASDRCDSKKLSALVRRNRRPRVAVATACGIGGDSSWLANQRLHTHHPVQEPDQVERPSDQVERPEVERVDDHETFNHRTRQRSTLALQLWYQPATRR